MSPFQNPNIEFTISDTNKVFTVLTSVNQDLNQQFKEYLNETYGNNSNERLHYIDIAEISKFIVTHFKLEKVDFFPNFFLQVENIINNCDKYIEDLVVIGLFESIQNLSGLEVDYYFGFDKWLQATSKSKWDNLIDAWEGADWRKIKK